MQSGNTITNMPLSDSDPPDIPDIVLPPIYLIADAISLKGQEQTKRRILAQLIALNIAAACSIFFLSVNIGSSTLELTGLVAMAAFSIVLILQIDRNVQRPERAWYDGRAVAESIKTLAWKYAVGSRPFTIEAEDSDESDRLLLRRFQDIVLQMKSLNHPSLVSKIGSEQITPSMRDSRGRSLHERKMTYDRWRIENQHAWYSKKKKWNQTRVNLSHWAVVIIVVVGFLTGLARAVDLSQFDYLGLAPTLIVTILTLLHLNQHETLVHAYDVTSLELKTIKDSIGPLNTEDSWSAFVSEAEEAISREHTLWLASYSTELGSL